MTERPRMLAPSRSSLAAARFCRAAANTSSSVTPQRRGDVSSRYARGELTRATSSRNGRAEPRARQVEAVRGGGRRQAGRDELAYEPLPVARVLLGLHKGPGQEQLAVHVLPGITHDRELPRTVVRVPDPDAPQLSQHNLGK